MIGGPELGSRLATYIAHLQEKNVGAGVGVLEDFEGDGILVLDQGLAQIHLDFVPLPGRQRVDDVHQHRVENRLAERLQDIMIK